MKTLIKDVLVVTMVEGTSPFKGDILMDGDVIAAINPQITAEVDEVIQGNGMVAMPGLINAHQHTPMSLLRGFSDDLKLMDWLEKKMLPAEARMTPRISIGDLN
jgi:5-methylthioadenosine/S-adenosylhomocysteine deaminase